MKAVLEAWYRFAFAHGTVAVDFVLQLSNYMVRAQDWFEAWCSPVDDLDVAVWLGCSPAQLHRLQRLFFAWSKVHGLKGSPLVRYVWQAWQLTWLIATYGLEVPWWSNGFDTSGI